MEKTNKKIILAISIGLAIIILAAAAYFISRQIKFNSLTEESNTLISQYKYQEAYNAANSASSINAEKAQALLAQTQKLIDSNKQFEEALVLENQKQFEESINHFKNVIEDDKKNFKNAKDKITSISDKFANNLMAEAKSHFKNKNFEKAYTLIQKILQISPDYKEAQKLKSEYQKASEKQKYEKEVKYLDGVISKANSQNIVQAKEILESYTTETHPSDLIKKAQQKMDSLDVAQKNILASIENLKNNDRYSQAIDTVNSTNLIEPNQKQSLISELETAKQKYIQEQKEKAEKREQSAVSIAKQLISKNLRAPSTASFVSYRVIKNTYPNYQIVMEVDAQNGFGAMIRQSFLTCFTMKDEGERFEYSTSYGVQSLGDTDELANMTLNLAIKLCETGSMF